MTTRFVGIGGNDSNNGLSWALRKLTLNGAEDTPVVAGDTVYIGPGTYREALTCDVSGTAGNPITYIGDYSGANTDGVGGEVRITGSDNDQTATRANCIVNSAPRAYRTFTGFRMDSTTGFLFATGAGADHNIIEKCALYVGAGAGVSLNGSATITNNTIQNNLFVGHRNLNSIVLSFATSQVADSGNFIQNNIFLGGTTQILITRIGGTTIRNNRFLFGGSTAGAVGSATALTGGQTITVNNNIFYACNTALAGQAGNADITENYNDFYNNITDRTNVNTGANSNTYPPMFDARWFFEMVNGGRLVTPFDLASYSQLINVAGTSPTTTDMRGTAVIGSQREWGALEYDATLRIACGIFTQRALITGV